MLAAAMTPPGDACATALKEAANWRIWSRWLQQFDFGRGPVRRVIGAKETRGDALVVDGLIVLTLCKSNQGPERRCGVEVWGSNSNMIKRDGSKGHDAPSKSTRGCVFSKHVAQHTADLTDRGFSTDGIDHQRHDVGLGIGGFSKCA